MTQSLYDVLGVRPRSRPATIKKAFYKLVKAAHPDTGGDRDAFDRLHLAYKILMDPDRRRKYDATGSIDAEQPDNSQAHILSMIVWAFDCVLAEVEKQKADILKQDMVKAMGQALDGRLTNVVERSLDGRKARSKLVKLLGRFTVKEGATNRLEEMLTAKISEIDNGMIRMEGERQSIIAALSLLKDYDFDKEQSAPTFFAAFQTTGASTSASSV